MASTFTTNLNLEEPATGDYVNAWASPVNFNFSIIDDIMGTSVPYTVTNGDYNFSVAQAAYLRILVSGTLTANVRLILPGTLGGRRYFYNTCTQGSYTVSALNGAGDSRGGVIIPYGLYCPILFVGGVALYDNYQSVPPGVIMNYAGATPPAGFLLCNGAAVSQTTYVDLYNAIGVTFGNPGGGNFNLPDSRGRFLAGADNMGGSAANRLTGYTVTSTGGAQAITLSTGQLPAHNHAITDPGHNHGVTDPGHAHPVAPGINANGYLFDVSSGGTGYGTGPSQKNTATTTGSQVTGVSINTNTTGISTQNAGGGSSVTIVPPTLAINHIIRF